LTRNRVTAYDKKFPDIPPKEEKAAANTVTNKHKEPVSYSANSKEKVHAENKSAPMSKSKDAAGTQRGSRKEGFLF
jgi:hypothetical protein